MRTVTRMLTVVIALSVLAGSVALADDGGAGKVFELKLQPLPGDRPSGLRWTGRSQKTIHKMPPGVEGKEAVSTEIDLRAAGIGRLQVILVESDLRLYVDADGDGRFEDGESYDLRRSLGPVRVVRSQPNYHYCIVHPIKLVGEADGKKCTHWIALRVVKYERGSQILGAYATCAMGEVKFGDREMRLAVFPNDPSRGFAQRVELPKGKTGEPSRGVRGAAQLMLDANGNGEFDRLNLYDMGFENRWLTRLVRLGGTYYELKVAPDARSVRITPAKPKLGTLKVPERIDSASVIGPEFAAVVTGEDKEVKLPVGRYVVHRYSYRTSQANVSAADQAMAAVLEIKQGKTTSFSVGAPLAISVDYQSGRPLAGARPNRLNLRFIIKDCAGRQITDLSSGRRQRPPVPRFKIVNQAGKTVLSEAFKYG